MNESISSPCVKPRRPSPPGHQQRIRISRIVAFLSGRTGVSATGGGTLHPIRFSSIFAPDGYGSTKAPAACGLGGGAPSSPGLIQIQQHPSRSPPPLCPVSRSTSESSGGDHVRGCDGEELYCPEGLCASRATQRRRTRRRRARSRRGQSRLVVYPHPCRGAPLQDCNSTCPVDR